jgi:hypothetical protein
MHTEVNWSMWDDPPLPFKACTLAIYLEFVFVSKDEPEQFA